MSWSFRRLNLRQVLSYVRLKSPVILVDINRGFLKSNLNKLTIISSHQGEKIVPANLGRTDVGALALRGCR